MHPVAEPEPEYQIKFNVTHMTASKGVSSPTVTLLKAFTPESSSFTSLFKCPCQEHIPNQHHDSYRNFVSSEPTLPLPDHHLRLRTPLSRH